MRSGVVSDGDRDVAGAAAVGSAATASAATAAEVDRADRCRVGAQLGREQQFLDDVAELSGAADDPSGLVDQVGVRTGCGERALEHLGAGVRLRERGPEFVARVGDEAPLPLAGEFERPDRPACDVGPDRQCGEQPDDARDEQCFDQAPPFAVLVGEIEPGLYGDVAAAGGTQLILATVRRDLADHDGMSRLDGGERARIERRPCSSGEDRIRPPSAW